MGKGTKTLKTEHVGNNSLDDNFVYQLSNYKQFSLNQVSVNRLYMGTEREWLMSSTVVLFDNIEGLFTESWGDSSG